MKKPTTASKPTANSISSTVAERPQTEQQKSSGAVNLPDNFDIELGEVAIYGGTFTYLDGKTGAKQQISDLELAILLPSLRKTLELKA